jgi:pimeloyl-ACP methyl ester carboxylesterase
MRGIYRSEGGQRILEERYRQYLLDWDVPHGEDLVPTRHGQTFVDTTGSAQAPPVVLLHGAGTNTTIWFDEARLWSVTRRVIIVDVIGEPGLSAESRPPLASDSYAEWLDDVLTYLEVSRPALVGASLGGWLAVDYAIRRPHAVERLALRAPGGIGRQRYGAIATALALSPFGRRGRRAAMRRALGWSSGFDEFVDYLALLQQHYRPRRDRLPTFTDAARRLHSCTPHAEVTLIPDGGHAVVGDTDAITAFLNAGVRS